MTDCSINTVAFGGEGVARRDGLVIFVPFTLPGEVIQCSIHQKKTHFARAHLLQVLQKNPHRITPPCPYFSFCGGCQLQHADYSLQLELKQRFVSDSLTRIGKISFSVPPVIPSSQAFSYRRHISLKLGKIEDHWQLCFSALDGSLLPIHSCLLFHEPGDAILTHLQASFAQINPLSLCEGRVKLLKQENGYVGACTFNTKLSIQTKEQLRTLLLPHLLSIHFQDEPEPPLFFSSMGLSIQYSPSSFVQNHPEQSEAIYAYVVDLLQDSHKIPDLYCGIGISSLLLAKQNKKVIGIEVNSTAIQLANSNAALNNISSISFISAPAEKATKETIDSFQPDSILVNPPKTGLDPLVKEALLASPIHSIVYVSCHPPTLARDLSFFTSNGFLLQKLQSFDMFPQTTHVETVIFLTKTI